MSGIIVVGLVIALCVMIECEHQRKLAERIKKRQERKYPAWPD